jgi:hypothetical protein
MARIRTIKPDFFTSEDITELTPLARLLYVALWCEADREGRLTWKPKTFKMRYLPADDVDIDTLCDQLLKRRLIVLYGNGLAFIPSFSAHQHVNPREAKSELPEPDASLTRADASNLDVHAQVGKERKGKEGEGRVPSRGKKGEVTLTEWVLALPEDEEVIAESDPIFTWALKVALPRDWIALAWFAFENRYGDNGKRYADWRKVFRKAVQEDWLKLWRADSQGRGWVLTTAGEMAQRERHA